MLRSLPNFLTLCNLFAGSCAIALLFGGRPDLALLLAVACLFLDVLDGLLARRLNVMGPLGGQLDSLADLVSFGILPSCMLYLMLADCTAATVTTLLPYTAFFVGTAVALRLALFNLDTRDGKVFYGLPSPSAAVVIFGLLFMQTRLHPWYSGLCSTPVFYLLVLLLPILMLSDLRLWSLKGLREKNGFLILGGFLTLFVILLFWIGSAAITTMVAIYIVFGVLNQLIKVY